MNIVIIIGTEIKGCTYEIKEIFLKNLKGNNNITEFYLPKDNPHFCIGCKKCFDVGEEFCPHKNYIMPIWNAIMKSEVVVFVYPVYVMRAPGQIKSLLDHFACHWIVHRPKEEMFSKKGVIITQSIGAPNGAAQKDVKTSLNWMGISKIDSLGIKLMEEVKWDKLSEKRRKLIENKVKSFAQRVSQGVKPKKSIKINGIYLMSKMLQKKLLKDGVKSLDVEYWKEKNWI